MNLKAFLIVFLLAVAAFVVATSLDADAARFGGGKSFGGKPSMSSPAPAPSSPGMQQRSMTNQPQGMPGAAAPKAGGMFGGMGGMFGGLLAGTLIGSMIGGGMGGGGGGFLDIIIFGLLIYFGLKLFARFRASRAARPAAEGPASYQGGYGSDNFRSGNTEYRSEPDYNSNSGQRQGYGGLDWSSLQNKENSEYTASRNDIPQGFDVDEFLRGAKMAFTRLQASWDKRDMKDIAQFTSQTVQKEIESQMADDPHPSTTEILLINAQLISVTEFGGEQTAKVYFDVMLREDPRNQASTQVREYWHFVRSISGGAWKLDGIQQVEN